MQVYGTMYIMSGVVRKRLQKPVFVEYLSSTNVLNRTQRTYSFEFHSSSSFNLLITILKIQYGTATWISTKFILSFKHPQITWL